MKICRKNAKKASVSLLAEMQSVSRSADLIKFHSTFILKTWLKHLNSTPEQIRLLDLANHKL